MSEISPPDVSGCRSEIQFIGLRIAYFRKMRSLTQAKLAELVGINKNYLSHIESGSSFKVISLPLLIKIAKALDVKLSILVDIEELNSPKDELLRELAAMTAILKDLKKINDDLDQMMFNLDNAENEKINRDLEKVMRSMEKYDADFNSEEGK